MTRAGNSHEQQILLDRFQGCSGIHQQQQQNILQTRFNSSEKIQMQSNGSMYQPRKILKMTFPED